MGRAKEALLRSIDDLPDDKLEEAISDFLEELKLMGKFLVWLEKWKALHRTS